jgi:predicted amidohydrolase YtcJ
VRFFEAAMAANPSRDRRYTIAHCQYVDAAYLPRSRSTRRDRCILGSMGGPPDELWAKVTTERWGKARANNMYRYGSVLRSGARDLRRHAV